MSGRPLSPDEVERHNNVGEVIKFVNKGLKEGSRTFARDLFAAQDLPVIMREFQAVGWDVELISDWRDGDYLQFKRRS